MNIRIGVLIGIVLSVACSSSSEEVDLRSFEKFSQVWLKDKNMISTLNRFNCGYDSKGGQIGVYGSSSGDGSSRSNAIIIDSTGAFNRMAQDTDNYDKYFILTEDLDFKGAIIQPIADISNPFTGTFEGFGHTLKNFTIDSAADANNRTAMFRYCEGATIFGVNIENAVLESDTPNDSRSYSSLLVAENDYQSRILYCNVNGSLKHTATQTATGGYDLVGLVAGSNHGQIEGCRVSGRLEAYSSADSYCSFGGLVGRQTGPLSTAGTGSCLNCTSDVDIYINGELDAGSNYVGGFAGSIVQTNSGANANYIENCHSTGNVFVNQVATTASNSYLFGGFIGSVTSKVINCSAACDSMEITCAGTYAADTVRCRIGGFVGGGLTLSGQSGDIDSCYCDVNLKIGYTDSALPNVGGFVGRFEYAITNCYSSGTIYDLTADGIALGFRYGGFAGKLALTSCDVDDCYCVIDTLYTGTNVAGFTVSEAASPNVDGTFWNSTTSGITASETSSTAKTTAEMTTSSATTFTAWGPPWAIVAGQYPKLLWE